MAAKAKKATVLSPDEKLKNALVPAEQQPYPVPGNWCWTQLDSLLSTSKEQTDSFANSSFKYVGLEHIEKDKGIVSYGSSENIKSLKKIFRKGQILYGKLRPYLNKHDVAKFDGVCSTDILVFNARPTTLNWFVNYFIEQLSFIEYAVSNSKGINLPRVSESIVLKAVCPLPPLPEQHRIVARIESLFAKLDEVKEKAQVVVDGYENRKAAILHKAFTGELTAKWRKEQGIIEQWTMKKLKKCGEWMGGGTPSMSHPEYWDNGDIPWVTSKDMKSVLIEDTLMHVNRLGINNSSANYNDRPSVLFVMRSGILRRTLPIAMIKKPFTVNQDLKAVSPSNDIDVDYLFWACENSKKDILNTCMKSGTTVESINANALMEYELPVAPLKEQTVIVKILTTLVDAEKEVKSSAESVLDQIDTMKKSILARAFRGELGTNDPEDEPAIEMLKRVLKES